jgi:hypothetical protein
MKRTLLAAMTLACIASPASAITVWQGDLFITAAVGGAACTAVNMNVGNYARGVFRPRGVSDNGTSDMLSWHFSASSGQVFMAPNVPLDGATSATVRIIYGSAGFNQFNNWTLSGVDVTPAAPTAATKTVAVQVTIQDIYSKKPNQPSNCDVTFQGTLARKP